MSIESVVAALASLADANTGDRPSLAGHFANVVDVGGAKIAMGTDGVGTKHLLANRPDHFRGIAVDCVAMNANDLICVGARPVAILDYLAIATAEGVEPYAAAIAAGFAYAESQGAGAVVGGEVAVLPEVIADRDDGVPGLDLAATAVGVVDGEVLDGTAVRPGDVVVAVASSGAHSNGFTRLRSLVAGAELDLDSPAPWGAPSLREDLLTPTLLYPRLMEAVSGFDVHAAANITGGGITNLARVLPTCGLDLDGWAEPRGVFAWLLDRVDPVEAYETWNMGVGFLLVVAAEAEDKVVDAAMQAGYRAWPVGRATEAVPAGRLRLSLGDVSLEADRRSIART